MNERFFDLKKPRQDQIINGAMRIFAENGYRHASTDEMVAAAGISKGLLFHYFKSKKGTWLFLYEYCTRYMLLELRKADRRQGCEFFEMYRRLVQVDAAVLKKYPWLPLFLKRADEEADKIKLAAELPDGLLREAAGHRESLLQAAGRPPFLSEEDITTLVQMLEYTRFGLLRELLKKEDEAAGEGPADKGSLDEIYAQKLSDYIRTLRKMNI
ncbi:MAG: TetR/AcrR family transcriptional regulator [Eubacteriales bacterium]|nr:TetR/AcrR family transcriptional regulator [Eubacteriales bacterium]